MSLLEWLGFKPKPKEVRAERIKVHSVRQYPSVEVVVLLTCDKRRYSPIPFKVTVNTLGETIVLECPQCGKKSVRFVDLVSASIFKPRSSIDDSDEVIIDLIDVSIIRPRLSGDSDKAFIITHRWDAPSLVYYSVDGHSASYIVTRDVEGKFIPNDIYQKFIS